ncbi:MAG TPA: UDP-N-acetylmuramoyl-tripeptide--D-alanyl-D-alanine ligase [Spirochaetota bacterium]|nr:UDP-N-acetylmuramoyl-tripeptide--D-alanyl-D-alanine ligase [Spirochaetota bacterium]HOD15448.1 UDP-N-acetylmuramoyl-tripeptide--D-alanyl-D-alanine ligase [Spirochaetota bacterium]HPG50727.1 UDP-N-acetylmuramoyl-tripeptide--D-alanyl-D-alanine ligase [Spirochaetota bacterium]HPN13285.1 UDP-N-acetylmuramoyl-tripeptide--D-alanyl-D-alanine ligase [Spirochaetota bacterium]HQL82100.1 UDP-N-acetylmuramoyl-tripeptide--D-alanyl-D-alanine ligase [Spirochaetota bacterium]
MIVEYRSTVERIAEACGGRITAGSGRTVIDTVTTDSRELGKNSLFVPIVGEKFDGHDFIPALSGAGSIRSYLTMKEGFTGTAAGRGIAEILCGNTRAALGALAARHRNAIDPIVVGITGTNGKTTTKELVCAILSTRRKCLKNDKNYNNEIGVPMTLLGLDESHQMAVIEMGMNHSGELDRLSRIVKPDLALITNVGEGHLEYLGSVENVARAKAEIMNGMVPGSTVVINRDMTCFDLVKRMARTTDLVVKTYGLTDDADVHPDSCRLSRESLEVTINGAEITAPLYGLHNVYNVLAAAAVAREYRIEPGEIGPALAGFVNVDGRSQIIDRGYLVINDSYNANPMSLVYALRSAGKIFPERRKIAVLSDMKELGDFAPQCHVESGKAVRENGFDMLLLWGDMSRYYAEGAAGAGLDPDRIRQFESKDELSRYLKDILDENDVVLIKGSRSMKMEEVVNAVTGREE